MHMTRALQQGFWGIILAFCIVLSAPAHAQDDRFVIGFPQDNMSNDWRRAQVLEVQSALSKYDNVDFIHTDAQGNTAKNIQDIEDLVDKGIDLLMISPRDSRAMTPVIAQVYARGIPVVLLTRRITGDAYTTFVSASDLKIAAQAAEHMAGAMGGKGRILVLQGVPTATTAIARTEGFMKAIAKHEGIEVVAVKPANYLRSDAIKMVEQAIDEGLQFDAIYAQSDSMAAGARLALSSQGIDPASLVIVGIDYIPEAREAIRAGQQNATFTYPTAGEQGAQAAMKILHGETVPRLIEVPSTMVTKDNVDAVEPIF